MTMRLITAAFALGVMAVSSASGALILHINTADKTFALTGSDTGTDSYPGDAAWGYTLTGGSSVDAAQRLDATQYSATPSDVTMGAFQISLNEGGDTQLLVGFQFANAGETHAISGTGVYASYASLSSAEQTAFERFIGNSLSSKPATGWSDMSVVAVPEPTSLALLGLGAAALGLRRRVRKA